MQQEDGDSKSGSGNQHSPGTYDEDDELIDMDDCPSDDEWKIGFNGSCNWLEIGSGVKYKMEKNKKSIITTNWQFESPLKQSIKHSVTNYHIESVGQLRSAEIKHESIEIMAFECEMIQQLLLDAGRKKLNEKGFICLAGSRHIIFQLIHDAFVQHHVSTLSVSRSHIWHSEI